MRRLSFLLVLMLFWGAVRAEVIVHNRADDPKEQLVVDLLKLALSETGGEHEFRALPEFVDQARAVEMLDKGTLTVLWAGTTREYEEKLLPIRIPVDKGMLGYRIFIIRKGDQALFDQVRNLDDLKRLRAGQGRFWGDTAVLKAAGLNVVTPVKYSSLFPMLAGNRFDYFPRAIHEPWSEVTAHKDLDLVVEKRILLVYPFAMYLFVAKDNQALARQIEKGFERAIADGSFDKLFYNLPVVRAAILDSDLKNRLVLRIPNPNMTQETPTQRKELWLDPTKLQ
ncbi:MAG TPA: hypothetical protein VFW68_11605 [Rhodocyclaceae bacterium]|nr:hypothetical protein [Rhodocyclaceae bacterium]